MLFMILDSFQLAQQFIYELSSYMLYRFNSLKLPADVAYDFLEEVLWFGFPCETS